MKHKVQIVGSAILSAVLAGSMMPISVYANEENPTEKTETVFTVLNTDGSVKDTTVSSWLHDEDGINNVKENLDLTDVQNVKTNEEPTVNGNTYVWNSKSQDIYYQGKTRKQLPVQVAITYELDGKKITTDELKGKTGHLKMNVHFNNTAEKTISVGGKNVTIHPSFLVAGMLMVDADHYTNVVCDNSKTLSDGTNEVLAFASVPGLPKTLDQLGLGQVNDALKISDDVVIEADVKDYQNSDLMFAMTNEMSMEEIADKLSTGDLTSSLSALFDASNQLLDGSKELYEGTKTLNTSAKPLVSAYPQIDLMAKNLPVLNDGATQLYKGIQSYTNGASQLNDGAKQLYGIVDGESKILDGFNKPTETNPSLVDGAKQIAEGLHNINGQLQSLEEPQLNAMKESMEKSKVLLKSMDKTLKEDTVTLQLMNTTLDGALKQVQNMDLSGVTNALNNIATTVGTDAALIEQNNAAIVKTNESNQANVNSVKQQLEASLNALKETRNQMAEKDPTQDLSGIDANIQALESQIQSTQWQNVEGLQQLQGISQNDLMVLANTKTELEKQITSMSGMVQGSVKTMKKLQKDVQDSLNHLKTLSDILTQTESALPADLPDMVKQLKQGLAKLEAGSTNLEKGVTQLNNGMGDLFNKSKEGIDSINQGTQTLVNNNEALLNGASQIVGGTTQLANSKGQLNQMSQGLQQLQVAFDTLENGASQLYDGQSRFNSEGMGQLKEMLDLTTGELNSLQTVFKEVDNYNKEFESFGGTSENVDTTVRYVLRTSSSDSKK